MALSHIPSVKDTYFQHKVLTTIHGKPTYETLHVLTTELKANASSVPSTLGGGSHGHLGLILSDIRYETLQTPPHLTPWVTPGNPGPYDPPEGTAAIITAAKDVWKELKYQFDLCQATEKALIAQIVEAIDPIYLRAMLNRATGQYSHSIRAVITHLFATHGRITPQQVSAKEQEALNMHYDISQPVDTVFNTIDDLADLSEQAESPMTARQHINLAYVILARQPILQQDLRLWNRTPALDRTWPNMLTHFREAQADLSSLPTSADVYHQQPPHQANAVSSMADLVAQRLLDSMPVREELSVAAPLDQANALQGREADLQAREHALQTQMQEMMALMRDSTTGSSNNRNRHSNNNRFRGRGANGRGNQRQDRNNDRRANGSRSSTREYCWTHGACAHGSVECETRATGHDTTATFTNMKGGSTKDCYWL